MVGRATPSAASIGSTLALFTDVTIVDPRCTRLRRSGCRNSVDLAFLIRAVERERRNFDVEPFAVVAPHAVGAEHDAGRRRQRRAAGVLERLARVQVVSDNLARFGQRGYGVSLYDAYTDALGKLKERVV